MPTASRVVPIASISRQNLSAARLARQSISKGDQMCIGGPGSAVGSGTGSQPQNAASPEAENRTAETTLARHRVACWSQGAELIAQLVQDEPAGPLELDLLVVPSVAHRRQLTQYLAARVGGPGISAGYEFCTLPELLHRLRSSTGAPDGWRGRALALSIRQVLAQQSTNPELAPIYQHLGSPERHPGRLHNTTRRIAALFSGYLRQRPQMLADWAAGQAIDPTGQPLGDRDRWQPALWRELIAWHGTDPVRQHTELLAQLRGAAVPGLARRILVSSVTELLDAELALLTALAGHHEVHLVELSGIRIHPARAGSDFARNHSHRPADEPADREARQNPADQRSLLAKVQAEVASDLVPTAGRVDDSLQIHACAGPNRQVAVLREVLCDLFSADASLQPRDVLVLCPQLDAYAELIRAAFTPDPSETSRWHPGHRLRVQLATSGSQSVNPVLVLLTRLFELYAGRATSADLVELCRLEPIAQRFEFGPDDLERIVQLVGQAQIRWGIDPAQRERNLVPIHQSTWQAGMDRLLLSLAMGQRPATQLGEVTPVPDVGAGEAALIGRLAELVSRVTAVLAEFGSPASVAGWVERLRIAIDRLVALPDDAGQLDQALDVLTGLVTTAGRVTAEYRAGDFAAQLAEAGRELPGRTNHGNGALLVTELGDAQAIEARVICILGLDDDRFPGSDVVDGDDLLSRPGAGIVRHWTQDRRAIRRQQLLDALLAAREHFIVITQGNDEFTGATRPQPICILDLVNACGVEPATAWQPGSQSRPLIRWHPLHAHDPAAFTAHPGIPRSFDEQAYRGARRLLAPTTPVPPRRRLEHPVRPTVGPVELDELTAFLRHPARELLRRQTGITLQASQQILDETLPIAPDPLTGWQVGNEIYADLLAGGSPGQASACAGLGGRILAGQLGSRLLSSQTAAARAAAERVQAARCGVPRWVDCAFEAADGQIVGRIPMSGAHIVQHGFRYAKIDDLLGIWLQILLLSASKPDRIPSGCFVGRNALLLTAPPPDQARRLLAGLLRLRTMGLRQAIPMPLRTAAAYLDFQSWQRDPDPAARTATAFATEDANWHYFFPTAADLLAARRPGATGRKDAIPWFAELARWVLNPIRRHTHAWAPGREAE